MGSLLKQDVWGIVATCCYLEVPFRSIPVWCKGGKKLPLDKLRHTYVTPQAALLGYPAPIYIADCSSLPTLCCVHLHCNSLSRNDLKATRVLVILIKAVLGRHHCPTIGFQQVNNRLATAGCKTAGSALWGDLVIMHLYAPEGRRIHFLSPNSRLNILRRKTGCEP